MDGFGYRAGGGPSACGIGGSRARFATGEATEDPRSQRGAEENKRRRQRWIRPASQRAIGGWGGSLSRENGLKGPKRHPPLLSRGGGPSGGSDRLLRGPSAGSRESHSAPRRLVETASPRGTSRSEDTGNPITDEDGRHDPPGNTETRNREYPTPLPNAGICPCPCFLP